MRTPRTRLGHPVIHTLGELFTKSVDIQRFEAPPSHLRRPMRIDRHIRRHAFCDGYDADCFCEGPGRQAERDDE
jgi:hypothetical protein